MWSYGITSKIQYTRVWNVSYLTKYFRKNSDPEYYNKDIKRLKAKVRKAYNSRKLGVQYMEKLKHLSKQLLAAKKEEQEAFLKSILNNEAKCWSNFYKYVKRHKGNRDNIPAIKDGDGRIVTDPTEIQGENK